MFRISRAAARASSRDRTDRPTRALASWRFGVTTKARGTGLGLALVQKIIVTHNGRVSAGSREQRGARLIVTLPLASQA